MYDSHKIAAELHDEPEHVHDVAEQQRQPDHGKDYEQSRHAQEHLQAQYQHDRAVTVGHGIAAFGHNDIAALAHTLWQARGCPGGSAEADWFLAVDQLRSRAFGH
jgi:hypothetical protein